MPRSPMRLLVISSRGEELNTAKLTIDEADTNLIEIILVIKTADIKANCVGSVLHLFTIIYVPKDQAYWRK